MVFWTIEKSDMMYKSQDSLYAFADAIKYIKIEYFYALQRCNIAFYNEFIHHLTQYRVKQKHLILAFQMLYPYDRNIKSSKILLKHLETIEPYIFGEPNLHKSNGEKYYRLTF